MLSLKAYNVAWRELELFCSLAEVWYSLAVDELMFGISRWFIT